MFFSIFSVENKVHKNCKFVQLITTDLLDRLDRLPLNVVQSILREFNDNSPLYSFYMTYFRYTNKLSSFKTREN